MSHQPQAATMAAKHVPAAEFGETANFTQLAPYKPYFIVATLALLGAGYWLVHRASKAACADGEACARPLPNQITKVVLVAATVLVIAAFAFDYVAPNLL
jgi:mercuric ion transport protein